MKKYWIILSSIHEAKFGDGEYKFKRMESKDDAIAAAKRCAVRFGYRFDVLEVVVGFDQPLPSLSEVKFEDPQ